MALNQLWKFGKGLNSLFAGNRRRPRRVQGRSNYGRRLRFESLEDWQVLAVIAMGSTGGADLIIFWTYYHTEENATFKEADFNGNRMVTQADRTILNNNNLRDLSGLVSDDWNSDGEVNAADYVL